VPAFGTSAALESVSAAVCVVSDLGAAVAASSVTARCTHSSWRRRGRTNALGVLDGRAIVELSSYRKRQRRWCIAMRST
jgi:hypothetical protein